MTEAMSRREIEDVLSSIRRLVAQDPPRPQDTPLDGDIEPAPGKLILTSELRVAEGMRDPAHENATSSDADPDAHEDAHAESDAQTQDPSEGAQAPSAIHMLRAMNQRDADDKLAQAQETAAAHTDNTGQQGATGADGDSDLALEATLARLEQVLSQPDKKLQPDSAPHVPASVTGAPASGSSDALDSGAPADEPVIDEAMLYQIVANIVRQELQGELGERITRNIRKLVRAEVARELQLRKS